MFYYNDEINNKEAMDNDKNIYSFSCKLTDGKEIKLSDFASKILLVVNTASKCGFTPQYKGLESLQKKYNASGFNVLGFPCNQFGSQEPGADEEIQEFCSVNFGVSFPIFSKIEVKGKSAHPIFQFLTSKCPGLMGSESIKWNFTKFLINKNGLPIKRFAPNTKPEKIASHIEGLLN